MKNIVLKPFFPFKILVISTINMVINHRQLPIPNCIFKSWQTWVTKMLRNLPIASSNAKINFIPSFIASWALLAIHLKPVRVSCKQKVIIDFWINHSININFNKSKKKNKLAMFNYIPKKILFIFLIKQKTNPDIYNVLRN